MARDCDVLVVGGGGAGIAAAIAAADAGASVVVLEAGKRPGGSTALSGGVFYAAGTSIQRAAGVEDDVERMYRYYMTFNRWNLEPWLIRRFCEESAPTLEWLIGLGVDYPVEGLYISGMDDTSRGHHSHGSGIEFFDRLLGAASTRGVAIHPNVRVESLIEEGGRVVGVRAQGAEMRAGAVVLATGGYGANRSLLAELNPDVAAQDERWSFYFGSETSRGDGIEMGRAVGAQVTGAGRLLVNASPGFSRDVADFHPPWLVFVNRNGERFMDETAPYAIAGHRIEDQPRGYCFAIFDEPTRASSPSRHPFADKLGVGDYAYSCDRLLEEARKGRVLTADTLDELAVKAGIDPVTLAGTLPRTTMMCGMEATGASSKRGRFRRLKRRLSTRPRFMPPASARPRRASGSTPTPMCWGRIRGRSPACSRREKRPAVCSVSVMWAAATTSPMRSSSGASPDETRRRWRCLSRTSRAHSLPEQSAAARSGSAG